MKFENCKKNFPTKAFAYCYGCKKNLCPSCYSKCTAAHPKTHENLLIHIREKPGRCLKHFDEKLFEEFCTDCKVGICLIDKENSKKKKKEKQNDDAETEIIGDEHKYHNKITFKELQKKVKEGIEIIEEKNNKMRDFIKMNNYCYKFL